MFQILFTYQRQWFIRKENDFRNLDLYQLREIKKKNSKARLLFLVPFEVISFSSSEHTGSNSCVALNISVCSSERCWGL